jgi:hypothetical protein
MPLCSARRYRALSGALALLAMLMLALAPALPRLHAELDPRAWVPVCTAAGLVHTQWQPDGTPMPNPAERAMQGDAACAALQAHAQALPAADVVLARPTLAGTERPRQHAARAPVVLVWTHAQPRAPPLA